MIILRPASERGRTAIGWLDSRHSFSFGDYHDPAQMGFRTLRVINDDHVAPAAGFGMHGHRDMEILTYIIDGALEHRDSLGTGEVLRVGDVQRMTAGSGIRHSEFNPSKTDPVHLLQIWLLPAQRGVAPSYAQKNFPEETKAGRLRLVAAPDGRDGSLTIGQDASVYASVLGPDQKVVHELENGRFAWLQVARGTLEVNGRKLNEGDGASVEGETRLEITTPEGGEFLLFDLA